MNDHPLQQGHSRFLSLGFSLMELMVTVAIVGILAAIAYPSYTGYVARARRADAQSALVGMAAAMERFAVNNGNGSYINATGVVPPVLPAVATFYSGQVPIDGGAATYNLRITALTATSYTLTATRTGSQAADKCGDLTLNSNSQQGIINQTTGTLVADCWRN
jgi:type IV pilus assembly protein PilE